MGLLAFVAMSCPQVIMINRTNFEWNEHDRVTKATCSRRCPELYPEAPCLKRFIKLDKQDYYCGCGEKHAS
jgi:hypothetical protein